MGMCLSIRRAALILRWMDGVGASSGIAPLSENILLLLLLSFMWFLLVAHNLVVVKMRYIFLILLTRMLLV